MTDDFDWSLEPKAVAAPTPAPVHARKRAEPAPEPEVEAYEERVRIDASVDPEYAPKEIDPSAGMEKAPPFDLDAEAAVLSAIFLDPMAIHQVADFLEEKHFYSGAHRRIYEASLWCHREQKAIDVVLIGDRLKKSDRLAEVGGMAYLSTIMTATPAHKNIRKHAIIVFDLWRVRTIIEQTRHILVSGYMGVPDVQVYADSAVRAIGAVARRSVGARGQTNVEALKALLSSFDREPSADGRPKRGVPYGYKTLDEMTGGMHAAEEIMVIARTGRGKTTFATDVAGHVASLGIGVEVFSTETKKRDWLQGLVCNRARVTNAIFKRPDERPPTVQEISRITAAAAQIAQWKWLRIDETDSPSVEYITGVVAARCTPEAQQVDGAPLGLVIVDHLHQLGLDRDSRQRTKWIEEDAHALKLLAERFKVPVLVLAQSCDVDFDRKTGAMPKPKSGMVSYAKMSENHASKVFVLQHPQRRGGRGEDQSRIVLYPTKGRGMARSEIEFELVGAESRLVDIDGETNDARQPMMAASRKQVDTRPEPEPRPNVPMTPAAASAVEPDDDVPEWYEADKGA